MRLLRRFYSTQIEIRDSPYINAATEDIESNMRWKRGNRLRLVEESEAPLRTREVFADGRQGRIGCEGGTCGKSTGFQRRLGLEPQPDSPTRAA
jgi:hypothetical protein